MEKSPQRLPASFRKDQRGTTIVLVAILMIVFLGIAAFAIDLSYLYVVHNELHNAADAGALAGARFLYSDNGTQVNVGANQIAFDAARANRAMASTGGAIAVDVNWPGIDVLRGHWSFANHTFTANEGTTAPVDLNRSIAELDSDPNFINAVKVVTRRQATPAASFFARIFGNENFELAAEAVAYIGFAGSLRPEDVDQPIAVCKQSIVNEDGTYTCATGRMINSSGGSTTNTAAWTNFSQPENCTGGANSNDLDGLVCAEGNPEALRFGEPMQTIGGQVNDDYNDLRNCWLNAPGLGQENDPRGYPTEPWTLTLPVIDCGNESNPSGCLDLVGVVTLDVLWIKQSGTDPHWTDIPVQMEGWTCSNGIDVGGMTDAQRRECWGEFIDEFDLETADDNSVGALSASDIQKTMFFRPDCEAHEPRGSTGGQNFGVLARIPVLVK